MPIAKCARCRKAFDRIRSPICSNCVPDEEADYEKIRDILANHDNLPAKEVAEKAEVTVDCVLRMIADGQVAYSDLLTPPTCGRCGAPAISPATRLCERCLGQLNREVVTNIGTMRKDVDTHRGGWRKQESQGRARSHSLRETIEGKRRGTSVDSIIRKLR